MSITLEAQTRTDMGKGASRRLRRLDNKIPGIIYGGDKKPQCIHLQHNKIVKSLENESIFSSMLNLKIDGKVEQVILKAMQRHPYKPIILHMDFQRVSATDVLVKPVPLHFMNQETSKGVKAGGRINHILTQVDVRCQAKDLPKFIEVDMANVDLDEVIHVRDLKLPKGVQLTIDADHNPPVAGIHLPKGNLTEEEEVVEEASVEESSATEENPEEPLPSS